MIGHEWLTWFGSTFELTPDNPDGKVWLTTDGIEGMGMPEQVEFTRDTALLDGQTFSGWRAKPREVFWPVVVDGTGMAENSWMNLLIYEFWRSLQPGKYGRWRVTTVNGTRDLTCRFVSDNSPKYANDPSLRQIEVHGVTLVADDPWWRGPEVSATFQTAEDTEPFFEPGPTHVFNLMSANTVASANISNPGEIPAWPVIRVDGPATAFSVTTEFSGVVAGEIEIADGEWLIIDTNRTKQNALLHTSEFSFTDVTRELTDVGFYPINAGLDRNVDVVLNGAGSVTVSLTPGYFRAF